MVELLVGTELDRVFERTDDVVTRDFAGQAAERKMPVMQISHGRYKTDLAPRRAPLFYFFADLRDAGGNLHRPDILPESHAKQ